MEQLFAYGTLRPSLYGAQTKRFGLTPVGDGTVKDFTMFNLGRFPCVVPEVGAIVIGEVVAVADLTAIDYYEGYQPDGDGLYDRKEVIVELAGAGKFQTRAWIYFMRAKPNTSGVIHVPTGDWLDVLKLSCK